MERRLPPRGARALLPLCGLSLLFALPVVAVAFPPMVDYPQHLALAAVVRHYGDAATGFAETFVLRPWRPHAAFPLLVAALGRVMPLELAGKLVVALSVAALGPAAWLLQRRGAAGGRDGEAAWWPWALAVLACGYGYAFWFGFVGTLLGYPLFLAGVALADRVVNGGAGWRAVLALAGLGLLLYTVHLQILVLLFGAAGWLTLVRRLAGRGWRWRGLLALAPGLALALAALAWVRLFVPVERLSALERAVRATGPAWNPPLAKLAQVTGLTFGVHRDHAELAASLLLLALVVAAVVLRRRGGGEAAHGGGWRRELYRHRVAGLSAALFAVYLLLPEWAGGYLVAGRVAPLAVMVGLCALPPPRPAGRRLAGFLVAALLAFQGAVVSLDFLVVQREAAGLRRVLAATEPGRDLLGLVFEPTSSRTPVFPVFAHFPAYYQVWRGGRVLVSQADFFHSVVDYRPGRDWGTLPVLLSERNPGDFDLGRHGPRFDYFLVRGPRQLLPQLFGGALADLSVVSSGRWHLVARRREGAAAR